ncbi:four helix bundle protein [Caldisalinibacter kiritimatiensis]|uniref:S23 ribosomal protein n=1 Tax=Caldisalinibacter kiritimatiensis TaxID=1304284 RepID=R1CSZ8_9FIRM|nr:four helix bundle protein [Caldisalinibacter kiritimatiensis]EOD01776.1 S23 ribosomal protein [Caldisalinibacter kiritimatiensis]
MADYKNLKVWQGAHKLTLAIYKTTSKFPHEERFALTSQLRRAASSILTNIAEGSGQLTDSNYARYLAIARGSVLEVSYLLILSKDLGYISIKDYNKLEQLNTEVTKMLHKFINKLRSN